MFFFGDEKRALSMTPPLETPAVRESQPCKTRGDERTCEKPRRRNLNLEKSWGPEP